MNLEASVFWKIFKEEFDINCLNLTVEFFPVSADSNKYFTIFDYLPYRYSIQAQLYYSAYYKLDCNMHDHKMAIIFVGGEVVGVSPITFSEDSQAVSSNGEPILFPYLDSKTNSEVSGSIMEKYISVIERLRRKFGLRCEGFREHEIELPQKIVDYLIRLGTRMIRSEIYFVDLERSHSEIWSGIRKSYKSIINSGLRNLESEICTGVNSTSYFRQFRNYHRFVTGRITRSDESWDLQEEELFSSRSILIVISHDESAVGYALFPFAHSASVYAVGVYDRNLPDLHLGHISLWTGLLQLRESGISRVRLGGLNLDGLTSITDKEKQINYFKRGFASSTTVEKSFFFISEI